jgi:hypothetical protein
MALECTTFGLREYLRRVSWAVDVEYLLDLFHKAHKPSNTVTNVRIRTLNLLESVYQWPITAYDKVDQLSI